MNSRRFYSFVLLALSIIAGASSCGQKPDTNREPRTAPMSPTAVGIETIVFLRHGEKPLHGLGQLTPQGLNRALALPAVLLGKFGKPDLIFAPDPGKTVNDYKVQYNYIRPLITVEPLAIQLEMTVHTLFGYLQIDQLNEELTKPENANAVIFIAWEHGYEAMAAQNLVAQFGGKKSDVPGWPDADFDSLFVLKITRTANNHPLSHSPTITKGSTIKTRGCRSLYQRRAGKSYRAQIKKNRAAPLREFASITVQAILVHMLERFGMADEIVELRKVLWRKYGVLVVSADSGFMKALSKSGEDPAEFQVRSALRFLLAVTPPLLSRDRNRYRPVRPTNSEAEAKAAWAALAKQSK